MKTIFDILEKQKYCIIAEIGVNYYDIANDRNISNMEAALLMCSEAYKAGADAVKFQTYKAEKLASRYSPSYWDTDEETTGSQYELFRKYDSFGEREYRKISEYCEKNDLIFMSTPFDFESVDYLDSMMNYYKISSSDITNIPFIRYIATKKKPILLSTGTATEEEIEQAVMEIEKTNNRLILMHCVLEYPTPYEHANLNRIKALKDRYPDIEIGYSDHTKPEENCNVIKTAYTLGAKVFEKHFTLNKTLKGNDHYHAMEPSDIKNIKENLEFVKKISGYGGLSYQGSEYAARLNARRSLVLADDLCAGDTIKKENLVFKRPGTGISPNAYEQVIGKHLLHDMKADSVLKWCDLI
jgi:N-acetylneuraminate synthase